MMNPQNDPYLTLAVTYIIQHMERRVIQLLAFIVMKPLLWGYKYNRSTMILQRTWCNGYNTANIMYRKDD